MLFWDLPTIQAHLTEDMSLLKNFGVKRIGLDAGSLATDSPYILVEFHSPEQGADKRRLRDITFLLMQTLGPTVSVTPYPFPYLSTDIALRISWVD